jgi:hypothetical protein
MKDDVGPSRMARLHPSTVLVLAPALLASAAPAHAFDWNARTVTQELDVLDGRIEVESGHPLATARAFELAEEAADAEGLAALAFVLGDDWQDQRADAMQTVLFGGWLNEVRTSLDMGDPSKKIDPLAWAAKFMGWRYADYLDGRERSDRWSESTRYSSSNYQHSMMVNSVDPAEVITQDDAFELMEEYLFWAASAAALNLMIAKKAELEGSMTEEQIDLSWVAGLRYVGSMFHVIEDSSVSCTDVGQRHVSNCLPGDGHVLLARVDGRTQVVALSDGHWYEREIEDGDKPHAGLDGLYTEETIDEVYGDFDPARVTSQVLLRMSVAVDDAVHGPLASVPLFVNGEPNPEFDAMAFSLAADAANAIFADVIDPRFADEGDRAELPPLPGADGEDGAKFDDLDEGDEGDGDASGCRIAAPEQGGLALGLLCLGALGLRRRRAV